MNKKNIAVVDFDKTLIDVDSFSYIMKSEKWYLKPSVLGRGISLSFAILFHRNELKKRSLFKKRLLELFDAMDENRKKNYIDFFRGHLNQPLIDEIQKQHYDEVVILSASEESLIVAVLQGKMEYTRIIANSLKQIPFTTCWGSEKLTRLRRIYPENGDFSFTSYSDSESDAPLFAISDHAFLVQDGKLSQIK